MVSLRFPVLAAVVAALLAVSLGSARAAEIPNSVTVTPAQLKKLGLNPSMLAIGVVSDDGSLFACTQASNRPQEIAQGHVVRLCLFHVDWGAKTATEQSLWLPITHFDQLEISPDNRWILVIGDWGTRFVGVDLGTMQAHVISQIEKGQPGFRSMPTVLWVENKTFHTVGYFVGSDGAVKNDAVVSIDPSGTSAAAVQQVRDISGLVHITQNYRCCRWFASDQAYFGGYRPDKLVHLYAFTGQPQLQDLDTAKVYASLAVGQDRVLYIDDQPDGSHQVMIKDVASSQTWHIGDKYTKYLYPYMSKDGATIMVSVFGDSGRTISTWYGHESDSFALKPVPGLVNTDIGTLRMADSGSTIIFFNKAGLRVQRLPAQ